MPLSDIKDVGILAGFVRWGWPWHGVISGGTIGATGQAHTQPASNDAWLIDMGLPAVTLTPDEQTAATALNHEWRNYALIPGGYVYGTHIGAEKFIHIDAAGVPWLIALAYSFPASQTLRITANITRFGLFDSGNPAPAVTSVQKVVDVVCTQIEIANPVATYTSRSAELQDVDTNGSRALIGVMLNSAGAAVDMFAVVTLTPSGSGGADGSGLVLSAVESMGQPSLTTSSALPQEFTYSDVFSGGIQCNYNCSYSEALANGFCGAGGTFTAQFQFFMSGFSQQVGLITHSHTTVARYAYFDSAGTIKAVRLRTGSIRTETEIPTSDWSFPVTTAVITCGDTVVSGYATRNSEYRNVFETGWMLMENDTVIDRLSWTNTEVTPYQWRVRYAGTSVLERIMQAGGTNVNQNQGSLAAYLPASASWAIVNGGAPSGAFRSPAGAAYTDSTAYIQDTSIYLGLHKMNSKAVAFIVKTPTQSAYGLAVTARGPLSVGLPPASTTQFAWQRKTLDYQFASSALAYV